MNNNGQNRIDLSDWVIHFVHKRIPEANLDDLKEIAASEGYDENFRLPDYYDEKGEPHYVLSEYEENEYQLFKNADAFEVLKKILHDGFIHSGWSLRNRKPAIYGPKSAVCFTEMPLYALIEYAKYRKRSGYVGSYGIAFHKEEVFKAGARPVIYGLSTNHNEAETHNGVFQGRMLSVESTGIGLQEQYRYVATNLEKDSTTGKSKIDWTHEREWRWALPDDTIGVPGIPFFLSKDYANFFSEVIIIVETDIEMYDTIYHLKTLYDSGGTNVGIDYDISKISAAKVISLETIAKIDKVDMTKIRLEDLSPKQMKVMPSFNPTPALTQKVRNAVIEAENIGIRAIDNFLKANPGFDDQKGLWGWATVCTTEQSEITQALLNEDLCHTYADGLYRLSIKGYKTSNLALLEIGADAAAEYLEETLGQGFFVITKLD